jgi:hypothetical protein
MSFELLRTYAPTTSVVLDFDYKAPPGQESPGSYLGGPYNVSSFVLTTGTADLRGGVRAKRQLNDFLAVSARAGFTWRFSHDVQYVIELNRNQFLGRIRPGAKVDASVEAVAQLGPVALAAAPVFTWRAATRLGVTSPGLTADANLEPVADSDGWSLDLALRSRLTLGRGLDLTPYFVLPLRGEDLQFFPLEEIHPTLGPTFGGVLEVRY